MYASAVNSKWRTSLRRAVRAGGPIRCWRSCWRRRFARRRSCRRWRSSATESWPTEAIDKRHMLLLYGVSKMEEQLAIVAATWTHGERVTGDFAADGHAEHPLHRDAIRQRRPAAESPIG